MTAAPENDQLNATPPASLHGVHIITALVTVALARWWFNHDRHIFHVAPDEPSQLAVARWLSGGNRWNMFDHATWQSGLAVLITPFYWFTDNGETVVRLALGLNAAIGGLGAVVLLLLLRRLTSVGPWPATAAAIVVALAPSSMSASSFVWAEPLVTIAFLTTALLTIRHFDTGSTATGCAAIVAAGLGYASHSRLLPLVGVVAVVLLGARLTAREWKSAVTLATTAAIMLAAAAVWTRIVLDRVWDDPSDQNTVGSVWDRAKQPVDVVEALVGQVWYQLAATFGATAIGAWIVIRSVRHVGNSDDHVDPVAARVLAALTVPMILLSAVFMADRPRSDQLIYGRYNDAVVWPLIGLGLIWTVRRVRHGFAREEVRLVSVIGALLLGTGAVVDARHGDAIAESFGVRSMIAGLLAYVSDGSLSVWRATVWPLATMAVLIVVAVGISRLGAGKRWALAVVAVCAASAFAIGTRRTDAVMDARLNGWQRSASIVEIDDIVPDGAPIGVRVVATRDDPPVGFTSQRQRYHVYQFYLPHRSFVRDRGADDDVGPYVLAPMRTSDLVANGARLLWKDPSIAIGLYQERP